MRNQHHVVVGVTEDFSDTSDTAVRWAAKEARTRNAPLRIVSAYESVLSSVPPALDTGGAAQRRDAAYRAVGEAIKVATRYIGPNDVTGEIVDASTVGAMVAETEGASLVVLGSRGLGALGSAVHGSVSVAVSARAQCPVVVVRGPAGTAAEGARVVAGVDVTEVSQDVLEFAFDYASRHNLPLSVVLCWHPDLLAAMQWRPEQPAPERIRARLAEDVAGWREKYPDVSVTETVLRERAPGGLVTASDAQVLLVVGRRDRSPVAQVLLGSTSHGVLHQATCPVAIVPAHYAE
jgi:nucleotide-binding universal stress UspA family protein